MKGTFIVKTVRTKRSAPEILDENRTASGYLLRKMKGNGGPGRDRTVSSCLESVTCSVFNELESRERRDSKLLAQISTKTWPLMVVTVGFHGRRSGVYAPLRTGAELCRTPTVYAQGLWSRTRFMRFSLNLLDSITCKRFRGHEMRASILMSVEAY